MSQPLAGRFQQASGLFFNPTASGTLFVAETDQIVSQTGDILTPNAVIGDLSTVWVGLNASSSADHYGVQVISGALSGVPANLGLLEIAGVTRNIGGLAWCN